MVKANGLEFMFLATVFRCYVVEKQRKQTVHAKSLLLLQLSRLPRRLQLYSHRRRSKVYNKDDGS